MSQEINTLIRDTDFTDLHNKSCLKGKSACLKEGSERTWLTYKIELKLIKEKERGEHGVHVISGQQTAFDSL